MRGFLVSFLTAAFVLMGAATQSRAADRDSFFGTWSVFKEGSGSKATCWAVTAQEGDARLNGSPLYVSVTKFPGKAPELAVYSDQRLPRSAGLTLSIGQRRYHLESTGGAAWLHDPDNRRAIEDLKAAETSRGNSDFSVSIPKLGSFGYSAKGFGAALDQALKSCK